MGPPDQDPLDQPHIHGAVLDVQDDAGIHVGQAASMGGDTLDISTDFGRLSRKMPANRGLSTEDFGSLCITTKKVGLCTEPCRPKRVRCTGRSPSPRPPPDRTAGTVPPMRRVAVVLTVVWGAVGVGPVDAHVCATPVAV